MKLIDFFRSKIILFVIQILILSLFLFYSGYQFSIAFDSTVTISQKRIIQFIANYVLFDNLASMSFIFFIWLITSLIPVFFYNNFKKAYSMNLMTFFFPNFFVFAFLYKLSRNYFNSYFLHHFLHSLLLGILIVVVSIGISLILKNIMKLKTKEQIENLNIIIDKIKSKCPNCGMEFNSTPIYCYNCNSKIALKSEENVRIK
jgi:DNA-directed RNA polymerase subunit RPC12/RpoP